MKKLTLSVAALTIAMMSFSQDTVDYQKVTTIQDEVTLTKFEIIEMINTIEDILEWQQQDMEDGDTNMGKYSEGWGSNYWLTLMVNELYTKLEDNE